MANGWTTYGKQQMFAIALAGAAAPALEVSLYTGTADPTGSPVELAVAGYGRAGVDLQSVTADEVTNSYDVVIGPLAACSYVGVGIGDPSGIWFFDDDNGTVAVADQHTVTFAAGQLLIQRTS